MMDKKIFFPNLDGLRFIAFLMVFFEHTLKTPIRMLNISMPWLDKLFYFITNGRTGVSIFFVLSGFLITYLILSEIGLNGKLDILKFYIRRTLRIWPLYFLILLIVFAVIMNLPGYQWSQYDFRPWYYFLFIGNFDVLHIVSTKGKELLSSAVTWSVAIEEQFYLVWPLLFGLIAVKFYKYIFPAILIVSYIFRIIYRSNAFVLYFHTLSVCGDLALGGWVAWLCFTKKEFTRLFENQSNQLRAGIYIAGILILYLLSFSASNLLRVFGGLIQTLFFCYIIVDQNFCKKNFLKFSGNRFITFWGKYTYGLYLWHPIILLATTAIFKNAFHLSVDNISTHLFLAPVVFFGSLLVSYGSYHFFESYFLNLKKKFAFINKT